MTTTDTAALCERLRAAPGPVWHRLGEKLPDRFRPLLIASKRDGEDFWRVRDANLRLRYEGAFPSLEDLKDGKPAYTWWFDCIYPGKGDMRLATADVLWRYMPMPDDDAPSLLDQVEAADTIERQAAEIERLQRLLNGRDDFIVAEGLWPKFCDGLPARTALTGEDLPQAPNNESPPA